MPCRASPAMISGSFHCARSVAVLIDSSEGSGGFMAGLSLDAVNREQRAHSRNGQLGVAQQVGGIGEPEQFGEMR
jgi:hypothetical protein